MLNFTAKDFVEAFEKWENGYRANPTSYFTLEETAAMEVSQLSVDRAEYFIELLTNKELTNE